MMAAERMMFMGGVTTENGTKIYKKNKLPELISISDNIPKVLNIDSSFTVTLMPGLSLDLLLPLLSFLSIKKTPLLQRRFLCVFLITYL